MFISQKGIKNTSNKIQTKLYRLLEKNSFILKLISLITKEMVSKQQDKKILEFITMNNSKPEIINQASPLYQILLEFYNNNKELISIIQENLSSLNQILEELQFQNNPILEIKTIKAQSPIDKLKYISDYITYQSREKEIEKLDAFLNSEESFKWQIIYGNPGLGKSRLAHEYLKSLPVYWEKGFLDINNFKNYIQWKPSLNTFIVIDNISINIELVKVFLEQIPRVIDKDIKVRVLLLERQLTTPFDWYNEKLLFGDNNNLIDYQFNNPILLSPLPKKALINIMRNFNKDIQKNLEFYKKFQEFDKEERALFAAIFGELSLGKDVTININNYLKSVYTSSIEKLDEKHLNLVIYCSVFKKIKLEENLHEHLPNCIEVDEEILSLFLDINKNMYLGISPDIIAEAFFLEYINPDSSLFRRKGTYINRLKNIKNYINFLYKQNIYLTALFSLKCLEDFPMHSSIEILFRKEYLEDIDFKKYPMAFKFPKMYIHELKNYNQNILANEYIEFGKNNFLNKDELYFNLIWGEIFKEKILEFYPVEKYKDGITFINTTYNRIRDLEFYPYVALINFLLSCTNFYIQHKKYKTANIYIGSAFEFLSILYKKGEKIDILLYQDFCETFDKLFNVEDYGFNTIGIKHIYLEKLKVIAYDYESLSYYESFFGLINNYICYLLQDELYFKLSDSLSNWTVAEIFKIDIQQLYLVCSYISNSLGIYKSKVYPLFSFYQRGSLLMECLNKVEKKNRIKILHILILWFKLYTKNHKETLFDKDSFDYYQSFEKIPLSPENWNKMFSTIQLEIQHLYKLAEEETNNFDF